MTRVATILAFLTATAGVASADVPGPFSPPGGEGFVVLALFGLVAVVVLVVWRRRRRRPPP